MVGGVLASRPQGLAVLVADFAPAGRRWRVGRLREARLPYAAEGESFVGTRRKTVCALEGGFSEAEAHARRGECGRVAAQEEKRRHLVCTQRHRVCERAERPRREGACVLEFVAALGAATDPAVAPSGGEILLGHERSHDQPGAGARPRRIAVVPLGDRRGLADDGGVGARDAAHPVDGRRVVLVEAHDGLHPGRLGTGDAARVRLVGVAVVVVVEAFAEALQRRPVLPDVLVREERLHAQRLAQILFRPLEEARFEVFLELGEDVRLGIVRRRLVGAAPRAPRGAEGGHVPDVLPLRGEVALVHEAEKRHSRLVGVGAPGVWVHMPEELGGLGKPVRVGDLIDEDERLVDVVGKRFVGCVAHAVVLAHVAPRYLPRDEEIGRDVDAAREKGGAETVHSVDLLRRPRMGVPLSPPSLVTHREAAVPAVETHGVVAHAHEAVGEHFRVVADGTASVEDEVRAVEAARDVRRVGEDEMLPARLKPAVLPRRGVGEAEDRKIERAARLDALAVVDGDPVRAGGNAIRGGGGTGGKDAKKHEKDSHRFHYPQMLDFKFRRRTRQRGGGRRRRRRREGGTSLRCIRSSR